MNEHVVEKVSLAALGTLVKQENSGFLRALSLPAGIMTPRQEWCERRFPNSLDHGISLQAQSWSQNQVLGHSLGTAVPAWVAGHGGAGSLDPISGPT